MKPPARRPPEADPTEVFRALSGAGSVLLTGHVRPDGDCLGSQVALARAIRAWGGQARILNPDPADRRFDHLTEWFELEVWDGGALPRHDAVVLLDCSDLDRLGAMGRQVASTSGKTVVLDHHLPGPTRWWDAGIVDPSSPATGLIVWRLIQAAGGTIDRGMAVGLFTALVTDTGWFRYPNTTAATLAAASQMVERGVDPAEVYRSLEQRRHPLHPIGLGRLLSRVEYIEDDQVAVLRLPWSDEAPFVDGDDALDVIRGVESVEVVLLVRECADGWCRLSARSKGDFDVEKLARKFGGGGHRRAAGARLTGPLEVAVDRAISAVRAMLAPAETHVEKGGEPAE